ncbi:MAG TPA: LCP family protein [Acidimicrobiales bacterium]|nr:LCP family protein [Acidimicrobiales bacterium]
MAEEAEVVHARRWPRRLLIGLNVFVALCLVTTGATYGYLKWQLGKVKKVDLCKVLRNCGDDDPGQPMNVLLVGSDSRADISKAEAKRFGAAGDVGGVRSDTIIVAHIDPKAQKASMISIPRDLAVHIAGTPGKSPERINSAFGKGPDVLIATIKDQLGIPIDHYAEVDFNTFRGVVDAIGGVTVYFGAPARDKETGLDVKAPGCVKMDGDLALNYVRSRKYEYLERGKWREDPTADLGRIQRQQSFIRTVLGKASTVGRNPVKLNEIINSAAPNLKIDAAFSTKDMLRLAKKFHTLDPNAVEMLRLPTTGVRINGAAVLQLQQPDAREIVDHFLGRASEEAAAGQAPPPKVLPGSVQVRVLNGTGADGQAGAAAKALERANFVIAGTGDSPAKAGTQTIVRYAQGQQAKAQLLQAYVDGPSHLVLDTSLRGTDLVLVTGPGFQGIKDAPGATPSTTAAPAATTTTTTTTAPADKNPTVPQQQC